MELIFPFLTGLEIRGLPIFMTLNIVEETVKAIH